MQKRGYIKMSKILYYTKSVCPYCMKMVNAVVIEKADNIYMDKQCDEHGKFHTLIWEDNADNYQKWLAYGGINTQELPQSVQQIDNWCKSADFQCEACQQPSSSALMTTNRCNMNCPICFTRTKSDDYYEPELEELKKLIVFYKKKAGNDALLELCGGEPTTRKDLPEIVQFAKNIGFDYIQLNTNGIELAKSIKYCCELKRNGLTTIYLGFDGITDKPYLAKYGKRMLEVKKKAVENCKKAGLAVILVTCIIPDENDSELGDIIEYAKKNLPTIKGVYFQPVSYFGTFSGDKIKRITIPKVLRNIEQQTNGEVSISHFSAGAYEHAQCSFNGNYVLLKNGKLLNISKATEKEWNPEAYKTIRKIVRKTWLPGPMQTLTIGGMAFQDAYNIDLIRTMRCSVQIIGKDCKMISLCSKYLTNYNGNKLNPGIS